MAETRERLGKQVAARYGIPKFYASHADLAADAAVEAVAAIGPEAVMWRVAVDLLQAGKHVYIEKPMATCVEHAQAMVQTAEAARRILMVAYPLRYDAGVQKGKSIIKELRQSGELGDIIFVHSQCIGGDWQAGFFDSASNIIKTDEPAPTTKPVVPEFVPEELKRRYLFLNNCYCHNLNLLRFLFGGNFRVAYASLDRPVCSVLLDSSTYNISLHIGAKRPDWWDEAVWVIYEKGWVKLEPPPRTLQNVSARVEVYRTNMRQFVEHRGPCEWSFRRQAEHFLECVLDGRETLSPGRDSIEDIKLMEAIFRSFLRNSGT